MVYFGEVWHQDDTFLTKLKVRAEVWEHCVEIELGSKIEGMGMREEEERGDGDHGVLDYFEEVVPSIQ